MRRTPSQRSCRSWAIEGAGRHTVAGRALQLFKRVAAARVVLMDLGDAGNWNGFEAGGADPADCAGAPPLPLSRLTAWGDENETAAIAARGKHRLPRGWKPAAAGNLAGKCSGKIRGPLNYSSGQKARLLPASRKGRRPLSTEDYMKSPSIPFTRRWPPGFPAEHFDQTHPCTGAGMARHSGRAGMY